MRMEGYRITKRVFLGKLEGRRLKGRLRKRWIDGIEEDMKIMGMRIWRRLMNDREERKKIMHVMRMEGYRITKRVFLGKLEGRRLKGRLRKT
ncbi:hypothetical protein C0J52_20059 [Blattella germanica]|nr:hypothetical protein C0J52_20059 [Blattella germanica]